MIRSDWEIEASCGLEDRGRRGCVQKVMRERVWRLILVGGGRWEDGLGYFVTMEYISMNLYVLASSPYAPSEDWVY